MGKLADDLVALAPTVVPQAETANARTRVVGDARTARFDFGLAIVVAWPLVLLSANRTWIFTNPYILPWFDPFVFLGYFHYYPEYLQASPTYYPGERLPWILPGYALYHLLAPVDANYALHLGVYWAAALALYCTLRELFGSRAALISTLTMGSYAGFLMAVGWDWVDGPAITYSLIATYGLTRAARRDRWRPAMLVGGAASAAALFSHTIMVALLPTPVIYYVLMNRRFRRHGLLASAGCFAVGFAGLVGLLGACNRLAGGPFLFFRSQLSVGTGVVTTGAKLATMEQWGWLLPIASWASIPMGIIIGCIVHLAVAGRWRRGRAPEPANQYEADQAYVRLVLSVQYVCMALTFVLLQLKVHAVLSFHFYTSLLIPGMMLVVGAFFSRLLANLTRSQWVTVVGSAVVILAVPLVAEVGSRLQAIIGTGFGHTYVFVPALIVFAGVVLVRCLGVNTLSLVVLLLCVSLANVTVANQTQFSVSYAQDRTAGFRAIVKATRAFQARNLDGQLGLWIDTCEQPLGPNILWATWIANHPRIGRFRALDYPPADIARFDPATVAKGSRIALLSGKPNAWEMAKTVLHARGFDAHVTDRHAIRQGDIKLALTVIEVTKVPGREAADR